MANEIKWKAVASGTLNINLAALSGSVNGNGVQSDAIDNSSNRYQKVAVWGKFTLGISPTSNKSIHVHFLASDAFGSSALRMDGMALTASAFQAKNSAELFTAWVTASAVTNEVIYGYGVIESLSPEWAIGVWHDTGPVFSTGTMHWVGYNPEVQ